MRADISRIAGRRALVALLAVLAGACGSETGPTTDLILNGTWSGGLGAGSGGAGRALRITWTIDVQPPASNHLTLTKQ